MHKVKGSWYFIKPLYSQYPALHLSALSLDSYLFTLLVLWVPVPWQHYIRSLYLALDLCPLPLSCWLNNSTHTHTDRPTDSCPGATFWICQGCFIQKLFDIIKLNLSLCCWCGGFEEVQFSVDNALTLCDSCGDLTYWYECDMWS